MLTDLLTSLELMCRLIMSQYILYHVAKQIWFLQSCNRDVNVSQYHISFPPIRFLFPILGSFYFSIPINHTHAIKQFLLLWSLLEGQQDLV